MGFKFETSKKGRSGYYTMKILHYINNLGSGGAEKLLTDILPLMKENGHEVHLVYSNGNKNVQFFNEIIKKSGVKITNLNMRFYNPFQIFKIVRIVKKEKYDVIHAHLSPTQMWLAIASLFFQKEARLIKTEHNVSNRRREISILKFIEKFIYSRFSLIIAITKEVKINLVDWLQTNIPIEIIPNGVNLDQIENAKKVEIKDVELKSENYNILMVGRFNGAKDQNNLIEAIALLPKNFHVFFAGEGELMDESKKMASDKLISDRVHFLGLRTDVYSLMNKVDLNVLSSNFEGLSGVTLESLASGKPFIGSNVPGINNIVPDQRFLFEKKNPQDLVNKIQQIQTDSSLSENMVEVALQHVQKFDIKLMAGEYLKFYDTVINKTQSA